ncbi:MAG: hypothetical protein ACI8O8_002167 [Oleiphilaceae bacterium]|jgi:hypothetical protein
MITASDSGLARRLYSEFKDSWSKVMATLQFQREQLAKELCVIELKLQGLRGRGICDLPSLKQLQDDHTRHMQLLDMIDQHLKISKVAIQKS